MVAPAVIATTPSNITEPLASPDTCACAATPNGEVVAVVGAFRKALEATYSASPFAHAAALLLACICRYGYPGCLSPATTPGISMGVPPPWLAVSLLHMIARPARCCREEHAAFAVEQQPLPV